MNPILYDDQPIIACSTGDLQNTALAVIRISGFKDPNIFNEFFTLNTSEINPRRAYFTEIINESKVLDEVVLTYFKAPSSYNGENIFEISVHGNQINIQSIMDLFVENKLCRRAFPGEFSYRALKNKKLNLAQVEGLDLLLNANSEFVKNQGLEALRGELYKKYILLHSIILDLKACLELSIDFSEDVGEEEVRNKFDKHLFELQQLLNELYNRTQSNNSDLLNPKVVLFGQPNAGKSSLFNILLGRNRSIVTSIAGTTRDYINESINFKNINFQLVDTAGVRGSNDEVESIGIEHSYSQLEDSFYKILVLNPFNFDAEEFSNIHFDLIIFTHADKENFISTLKNLDLKVYADKYFYTFSGLIGAEGKWSDRGKIEVGPMGAEGKWSDRGKIEVGPIEPDEILAFSFDKYLKSLRDNPILLSRHKEIIKDLHIQFNNFRELYREEVDIAIVCSEFDLVLEKAGQLIGITTADEVLGHIFANFCIGK